MNVPNRAGRMFFTVDGVDLECNVVGVICYPWNIIAQLFGVKIVPFDSWIKVNLGRVPLVSADALSWECVEVFDSCSNVLYLLLGDRLSAQAWGRIPRSRRSGEVVTHSPNISYGTRLIILHKTIIPRAWLLEVRLALELLRSSCDCFAKTNCGKES